MWIILFPKANDLDVSQFDQRFTKLPAVDSPCEASLSESVNKIFQVMVLYINSVFFHKCLDSLFHLCLRLLSHLLFAI